MKVSFITCDVFTDRPFSGNPLLVVPEGRGLTSGQMQAIAREINYSESTFVLPPDDPRHAYRQRTFLPQREIPFAGHPTVGTAVVMASLGRIGGKGDEVPVTIEVGFGPLGLSLLKRKGTFSRVRMSQGKPAWEKPVLSVELLGKIAAALGVSYEDLHPDLPPRIVSTGNRMLIAPLKGLNALSASTPDTRLFQVLERELDVLLVYPVVFTDGGRIRARGFAPGAGVAEDPATGSAAGPLGIYLALHKALPNGSPRFFIDQGIEMGRPSEIEVEVERSAGGSPTGISVTGSAVRMIEGTIEV